MKISIDHQIKDARCVYCREAVGENDSAQCQRCQTALHLECSAELQGLCPVLGCVGALQEQNSSQQVKTELKRRPHPARDQVVVVFPVWLPLLIFLSILGSVFSMVAVLLVAHPMAFNIGVLSTCTICGMIFFQNFRQSIALKAPILPKSENLAAFHDKLVAVSGPMNSDLPPLTTPHGYECLWYKQITRRYSKLGTKRKNRDQFAWVDVGEESGEYCRPFHLGDVTISNEITEPSGYKEIVRFINRANEGPDSVGDVKEIVQFLEEGTVVTAVGRLFKEGKNWVLKRDMTGLILTTTPEIICRNSRRNMGASLVFLSVYTLVAYFWVF